MSDRDDNNDKKDVDKAIGIEESSIDSINSIESNSNTTNIDNDNNISNIDSGSNTNSGLTSATTIATATNTTTQSPRRSARLMNKRERESDTDDLNEEANTRNSRIREDDSIGNGRSSANTNTTASTSIPSISTPRTSTNPPYMPVISFTFGISGPVGNFTTVPFDDLPEDIRQINEIFRGGAGPAPNARFMIPFTMRSSRSSATNTNANANGIGGDELLQLARQMFQIISQSALNQDELAFEPLLNDLFANILNQPQGPAGLTDAQIAKLPVLNAASDSHETEIDCAICRETTRVDAEKCVKLGCKHCFHFGCIEPWLKRVPSCPICRHVVKNE